MYNKLFGKILDSSIWLAPDPHRIVWITLLAAMDEDGFAAFAAVANLAHRARVAIAAAQDAVAAFEGPDTESGDPDNDGRRIERVPGGWIVLNAWKYRDIVTRQMAREKTRARVEKFRAKGRNAEVTPGNAAAISVTQSDSYSGSASETDSESDLAGPKPDPREWFLRFKAAYPKRAGDQNWRRAEKAGMARLKAGATREQLIEGATRYAAFIAATGKLGTEYVKQAATFLGPDEHYLQAWEIPRAANGKPPSTDNDDVPTWATPEEKAEILRERAKGPDANQGH